MQPGVSITTTRLLEALLDPADQQVWCDIDARYRPIIIALGLHLGLGPDDAAEVAQATLVEFARDYREGRYSRERGRLRGWLLGIARHRITDAFRERARKRGNRGESAIDQVPGPDEIESIWEAERRTLILQTALDHLRTSTAIDEKTLRAFELVAIRRVPVDVVAAECGVSAPEVYRIKHRVTARLKTIVRQITDAYDEGE